VVVRVALVICWLAGAAAANPLPPGFTVVPGSISPDNKLGVIAPDVDHVKEGAHQNQLVELATGKVLATIDADTAFPHQNHVDLAPRWSADGLWLAWYADGKWGSWVFVLVKVDGGAVRQQIDVRELGVKAALAAARKANPKAYDAAKAEGKGAGSWYRDGFAIDVRPDGDKLALPLKVSVTMTSNPKELDDYPAAARFAGTMAGFVGADGKVGFGALTVAK
jgi:hypothetical protein